MRGVLDNATRLTDQLQAVVGYLETGQPQKALEAARGSIVTLHLMATAWAIYAAEYDSMAAQFHSLTSDLTSRKPPRPVLPP